MKADDRSFEINYKDLVRISDRGEDIYGSELGRDIVRAGCGGLYSLQGDASN